MLAVDTNLIVRYLAWDDPVQSPLAADIIEREHVFVSTTVLLETEWVLRSVHKFPSDRIRTALRRIAGLPTIEMQNQASAALALDWTERGMDFADALHVAQASGCTGFVTLDRRTGRNAQQDRRSAALAASDSCPIGP